MRIFPVLLVVLNVLYTCARSQSADAGSIPTERHDFQSDVSRLRKIVINSLYSHREVFIRELISNANDAVEKLRLTALTNKDAWNGEDPLNITIRAFKGDDGRGRIVITDTGIGMSPEELTSHLGTLAKSGTSDFLAKVGDNPTNIGANLIGQFGLGFYSSFLVADNVYVASVPVKSEKTPDPQQYVFKSSADESTFEIYQDPRGNTLGRGTEITLVLKEDALEYLDETTLAKLINKHSTFSTSFPIYQYRQVTEEVPDEDPDSHLKTDTETATDDEVVIEDIVSDAEEEEAKPKMKTIVRDTWDHLNAQPALWMRDPKNISHHEYTLNYQATFKDFRMPLTWIHFSGETSSGISFRTIIYVPAELERDFWQQAGIANKGNIRLMVKRVFITSDLGEEGLPKWASWVAAIVDAEDLPLNVSRETLQSNRFLKEIKQIIVRRIIQHFARLAKEDKETFDKIQTAYGTSIKIGSVEDTKNREKLLPLVRFPTNQRNSVSLDEYLENKKQGQKQIFFHADVGKSVEELGQSVFVEKLHARGYEVLLLNEPVDEIMVQTVQKWKGMPFQNVARAGLLFGDENSNAGGEAEQLAELTEEYQPLLKWLKEEATDTVRDVVISNRLVTSPCAIVADTYGYTANLQKLMRASNEKTDNEHMMKFAQKQKVLEINPRSPLIEGLLRRIIELEQEEERDVETEQELKEVTSILIDGALVRSGFDVPDSNRFFSRMDRVLRRSLGVSQSASADSSVHPAPPTDPTLPKEGVDHNDEGDTSESWPEGLLFELEDIEDVPLHDEL